MVGVPTSCALLGGFAVAARVALLWQHSGEREMSASACTRSCAWISYLTDIDDTLQYFHDIHFSYGAVTDFRQFVFPLPPAQLTTSEQ